MTESEHLEIVGQRPTAAERLRWLCSELAAGNQFGLADLHRWQREADHECRRVAAARREAERTAG